MPMPTVEGDALDGQLSVIDQLLTFCSQAIARFDQLFAGNTPSDRPSYDDESSLNETIDQLTALVHRAVTIALSVDPSGRMVELIENLYGLTLLVIAAKHMELAPKLEPDLALALQELGREGVDRVYSQYHQELHALVAEIYRRGPEA